ncbi:MAG TPA: ABC transporter permease, partial [Lacunisphaera sp.]|nr:ABC transporter permease [Lacunisphaera sp.]
RVLASRMHDLLQDWKFSLRFLARTPGFTLAAITVLALGIGLNTAMFSIIHALIFRARPFPEPERVVQLYTQDKKRPDDYRAFSHTAYEALRERSDLFEGVLAHSLSMVGVGEGTESRRTFAGIVSADFFDVLRVKLLRGRGFTRAEARPGANQPVVIVSHLYWRKTGFDPALLGSTIRINERHFTVVGITPPGFSGTMTLIGPELYFPLGVFDLLANDFQEEEQRRMLGRPDAFNLFLVARLRPEVSLEAIRTALAGLSGGLEEQFPAEYRDKLVTLAPLPRFGTNTSPGGEGGLNLFGTVLLGMTGAVLLVVCLNLAGMLLARGHARRREFAIRLALGGGRARIVRQLLTEGLVLALAGGGLGFLLASYSTDLLVASIGALAPVAIFFPGASTAPVFTATVGFCLLATLFFALGPALKLARSDVLTDLKLQAGDDSGRKRRLWLPRHPLVVAQIALSLALLVAAGLFVRMAFRVSTADNGYHADDTIIAEIDASLGGYDENRSRAIYRDLGERLSALPGVSSASIGSIIPYGLIDIDRSVRRAGTQPPPGAKPATAAEGRAFAAGWNSVGPDYFAAMGLTLLRGRTFTRAESEGRDAPPVAIIDEGMARELWPDGDALGQHVQLDGAGSGPDSGDKTEVPQVIEVVGIVSSTRADIFDRKLGRSVYVPFGQGFISNVHFHVRPAAPGAMAALGLIEMVRRELQAAAPGVPVFKVRTFGQHRDASIEFWAVRSGTALFSLFGGLAMLVAVVGIYGLKAYAVSRRTREIGIRMALGAEPARVRNLILREGLTMILQGILLGLFLGLGVGRVLATVFVDFSPFDPLAFGTAAVVLILSALAACWIPARKATRVDPTVALRAE